MRDYDYKVRYLQAYIHFRKHKHVKIRLPQSMPERNLMNHAYHAAVNYMNSIGKQIHV